MANPVLTLTTNKSQYSPGEAITGTWTVIDADNAVLTVRGEGTDSQGNHVQVDTTVTRIDPFDMERVYIVETGQDLTLNEPARTYSGTVPTA